MSQLVIIREKGDITVAKVEEPSSVVLPHTPNTVVVTRAGRGPEGTKGDKGQDGKDGLNGQDGKDGKDGQDGAVGTVTHFEFEQSMPSALWHIVHGLHNYPSVTVIDSAHQTVVGDVTYLDNNTVEVAFGAPFSGQAYLI